MQVSANTTPASADFFGCRSAARWGTLGKLLPNAIRPLEFSTFASPKYTSSMPHKVGRASACQGPNAIRPLLTATGMPVGTQRTNTGDSFRSATVMMRADRLGPTVHRQEPLTD
jgi:hypothetical protein